MARMNQAMSDLLRYNAAMLPQKRSAFNKSHSHTTTFDSGYLIPLMWDRVLPGDEKKIKYSGLARMATPIHPVMDEANLDVWAFYVPDRLWWNHAREFYGENKDASFNPDGEYVMPYLNSTRYSVVNGDTDEYNGIGSLNDYFGFPIMSRETASSRSDDPNYYCSAGLHRSYQLIWNEWFRNSSIQPALQLNDGDTVSASEWLVIRELRKANKYPDYFTTLLREPQAGDDVLLPLGDFAPVVTRSVDVVQERTADFVGVKFMEDDSTFINSSGNLIGGYKNGVQTLFDYNASTVDLTDSSVAIPRNLWANLTAANTATINNLRAAITVQHLLEVDALAGKRYQQILQAHFGVLTPDATLQRPELLGATRTSIGMRQVIQTSETSADSPLGNVAAFSLTNVSNEWICNKAFTEPGILMVIGCVRPVISYSQGLDPLLQKLERYDHYWPVFDNLGNQPVYSRALYAGDNAADSSQVLGYAEAWTEYRIKNNRVSGLMRPDASGTLASWNYSLDFEASPVLDSAFIEVDPLLIDRTIATPDEPQFICDSYFDYIDIKNMSVHSIPGLTRL